MGIFKKFKIMEVPRRYVFVDPDKRYEFVAADMESLLNHIREYRAQNNLEPIESLESVVQNYLCGLPENAGRCEGLPLKRGWFQYIRGGVALVSMVMFKRVVDQDEAEKRAMQCASCDNNSFPEENSFDQLADSLADAATGGKSVSVAKQLGICSVCTCVLRAAVFEGGKHKVTPEEKVEMAKVNCWKLKTV